MRIEHLAVKAKDRARLLVLLAALAFAAGCGRPGAPVDMASQLRVLTDPLGLARLDQPGATLASSFDPTGGNDDFNHPLRKGPDGWCVLADLKGPGVMTRFWTTGADDGKWPVRFYFDGETAPRIDTTLERLCYNAGTSLSPLAAYEPFCWFTLAPVPYRKRLIVMTREGGFRPDGSPRLFFQIASRRFPRGTQVTEAPALDSPAMSNLLKTARQALLDEVAAPVPVRALGEPGERQDGSLPSVTNVLIVPAGQRASLVLPPGPAIVRQLTIRPDWAAFGSVMERDAALRRIVLRLAWDDADQPSVEVPLGDIFGSVWRPRQFRSFYFGMTNGAYFIRFPMPYRTSARLELENPTARAVACTVGVWTEKLPGWTPGTWGYFHAAWNKSGPQNVGQPHGILTASGRGRYVGCILAVTSLDKSWWILEGDETICVDGESAPSWHGTGLEDYFNGGWYYGRPIVRPFHGLVCKAPFRTVQYRIHQYDPVTFRDGVRVAIERGPDQASHGWMESVAFYYLEGPARAASALGAPAWRDTAFDELRPVVLMPEINDAELLDDYAQAEDLVQEVQQSWTGYPYLPVLRLRSLLYRERREGWDAVKADVAKFAAAAAAGTLARKQAEDWLWFHASPSNALLAVFCNMRTTAYLDGQAVATAGDPARMQFARVQVGPGRHALALEVDYHPYPGWAQACLRTHQRDVITGSDWRAAYAPTGAWAEAGYDDASWKHVVRGGPEMGKGPPVDPWIGLEPYAVVGIQSRARGIGPVEEFADKRRRSVLRTTFEIPGD